MTFDFVIETFIYKAIFSGFLSKISPHSFVYSDKLQLWMVTMSLKGDPSF